MILVTGATGTVGRALLARLPTGCAVRVLARDPGRVTAAAGGGVEVVTGDYGDADALARAMAGVRAAFLVTNRVADDDLRLVRAARAGGVRHLVKLSAAAVADPSADDAITRWQRDAEAAVCGSGLAWTLLRPRAFMSNALSWAPSIRAERVVRALYGTSGNACVDPRDIAEVAVRALTEGGHAGAVHTLTGPEVISPAEQTAQLGRLLQVPLRFEELAPDAARAVLRARYPEPVVEALLSSAGRQRDGAKEQVSDTVRAVTGRPARSFRDWAGDHLSSFAAAPAAG